MFLFSFFKYYSMIVFKLHHQKCFFALLANVPSETVGSFHLELFIFSPVCYNEISIAGFPG